MLRRKVAESLTARIFLITAIILLGAGAITFGLIAWATPSTYTAVVNRDLTEQVGLLAERLAETSPDSCGALLDEFILSSGASAILVGPDGSPVETGSSLMVQAVYGDDTVVFQTSEEESAVSYAAVETESEQSMTVTMSEQTAITAEVRFSGQEGLYTLYVTPRLEVENLAVRALVQMAPWLLLALLAFSLLCAMIYSRYITRPVVRLSAIAGKMAELDFHWSCGETRRDEIGQLGRSLDEMARRLDGALTDLETANQALRGEVERERELDRQRMAFFSAASHELKTPVTILRGQLAGMLEGVGVYQDRDKYLLRSLQVTGRMENLIREMLAISRMETGSVAVRQEAVDLSALAAEQLRLDAELLEQRGQRLVSDLTPGISVTGDPSLLGKAVGNLLSNAALYSPDGAEVRVWCGLLEGSPALTVENTGAHIREEALPHLFEPFYREEGSRNRSTGGSGLGLYLVKVILDRHGAACTIENTAEGVRAVVRFPCEST
ncbi:MAG TPA: HAMP domain-containing protein [Candidatus Pelethomonas intestinigallinarum]|nr:HAMP domain-containing protein [Candidatus Pelethomonas intestinigallinarum]